MSVLQPIAPDSGPAAKIFKPLFPPRLNFTGMARPAFTELRIGRLPTGEKKPAKLYTTETVKLQVAELPEASMAVTVTVVVPSGKTDPDP